MPVSAREHGQTAGGVSSAATRATPDSTKSTVTFTIEQKPANAGPHTPDRASGLLPYFAIAVAVVIVCAFILSLRTRGRTNPPEPEMTRGRFFRSQAWTFCQTLLFGLLLIAAFWHSIAASDGPDAVTLSFVVLAFIVSVMPLVEKISFPGSGSIDLGGQVKSDVNALEQYGARVQLALATAGLRMTQTLNDIMAAPRAGRALVASTNLLAATESVSGFLRPPDPSASAALPAPTTATPGAGAPPIIIQVTPPATAPSPVEPIRVSAWIVSKDGAALGFVTGWPAAEVSMLKGSYIKLDDGSGPSSVFRSFQPLNYAIVPASLRPARDTQAYNGLLVLPLFSGARCVGVLQVERERAERFEPISIVMAKQLAALYAAALTL